MKFDIQEYANKTMEELDFPKEAIDGLNHNLSIILENEEAKKIFENNIDKYEENINLNYDEVLKDMDKVAEITGVHKFKTEFLVFLVFSKHLKDVYIQNKVDLKIWHDSMSDLKWKLLECKAVKNMWGSFVAWWFPGFFNFTRFALGRLQFEIVKFGEEYSENGKTLTKDSKVINIHIPRTCTPMDKESCDNAYSQAKEFFKDQLDGAPVAFVCFSWLLYPDNDKVLPEKSNVRRFKSQFTIVKQYDDKEGQRPDMWRLFDMDYTGDPYDFPGDSSLRRAFKNHLINNGKTGEGYGVFFA